jgi:outer membrane protein assembly factor BamA
MRHHKRLVTYFSVTLPALAFLATPHNIHAQRPARPVEAVQVECNRRLSAEEILSHVKTQPGDEFSEKQLRLDLQALLEWGVFDKTQTSVSVDTGQRGGVVVTFNLEELPLILEVKFKGLTDVQEAEVLQALRENKVLLAKGEIYDSFKVHAAVVVIRRLFASRGCRNTSITIRSEVGDTYASIEFLIDDKK